MASKRKSTTPCMIPLKTMNLHEDHEPDAEEPNSRPQSPLDLFLPGDEGGLDTQEGSESSGEGSELHRGEGTFACQPCYFDSQDLNLFLDHMYSQHPDFRVEPSFSCLDCRLSTKSYESLALHNARVHPNLGARGGSSEGMAWQVGKKDGRTVVEQSLVTTDGLEGGRESEISITKTPIMKMLKGKSESKRIVVSHSGDEPDASSRSREPEKKKEIVVTSAATTVVPNGAASKVSHPTMVHIVNSSSTVPVLKTAITQVVSVLQNRSLQQQAPTVSKSSSHLPKVMIPLSSIPTYNAAMDTNCFLKASFSKFSYPTKAELCYLTVVTKYREEQIKIWFTAQRLKQGISWSPEEIEDARRKMFSTIIQTSPRQSQQQQTITVLPASLGSNGMHHILQGSLLGQTGVIVTQPVMANGIQVSRSPMALAVTPKPQMATRPQMAVRPTAALVADKGAAVIVSTPSSINSSSIINSSSSSSSIKVEGSLPPIVNVTPSTRTLPSSILDPSFYKNKKSQEQLTALKQSFFRNQFPQQEEVERLTRITGLSTRENRSLQQQAPTVSKSSSHLPKVMIPLSSIPTYNAAMDTNCFLKASFSKFSYPTKAELCYLTVVTKYREEQIKIWFTAQRLKQGISWSPEEIEDARRKMFSTIIQTSPRQSQQQQTITVLPASLGSNGMHHILQGSLLGQTGVIVTQPVMANGIQVSRSPMALAVTPKPQMATRPQMAVRPTAALVADKGAAVIVSTPSSINSSSSSIINSSSSSSSIINSSSSSSSSSIKVEGSLPPIVNVTPSTRTLPSSILDPSFYKNKKSQEQLTALKQSFFRNQFPQQEEVERLTRITGLSTREVRKWFSDRRYHYRNLKGTRSFMGSVISGGAGGASLLDSVDSSPSLASLSLQQHHHNTHHHHQQQQQQQQAPSTPSRRTTWHQTPDFTAIRYKERDPQQVRTLEASFIANPEPSGDEVDRLRSETKMTRREIDGWFSERRKKAAADKEKQEKEEEEEEEENYREEESSGEKARAQRREGDDRQKESSATELKVSPIKINLKMLKVTESVNGKHGPLTTQVSPPAQTESPKVSPAMSSRSKKTPEQLHVLKQLFARTQWPSNVQYDQLSSQTGLLRSEVVRWFGDSRYVNKNGQLRWLEEYQRLADEQEKGDIGALEDDQTIPKTLQEKELVETSRLKEEEVQGWSSKHTTEEGEAKGSVEETADGKGVQKPRDEDERSENSENSEGGCVLETSKEERTSQEPELSNSLSSAAIKLGKL
ncbi:UNVERIFIED_CONTAM: hypothetical protein FKN15_077169 [Acipenser sinensis]